MQADQIILLLTIAVSASFTPGPNNALLAASGAVHGFMATMPHIAGIAISFPFMIAIIGLFLGEIFQQSQSLQISVQVVGIAILLWMAWKTATAGPAGRAQARKPFTFWQSAAFQWINPKGWTFAIGVTSQFVDPKAPALTAAICGGAFMIVGLGSAFTWTFAGKAVTRFLTTNLRWRVFNVVMGFLIAMSVLMLFASGSK